MPKQEGEPLINWSKLSAFPVDAKRVIHIREEVERALKQREGERGPVDDLIVEEQRADLRAINREVVHPVTFMMPNIILRVLAEFDSLQKVDLP